MANAAPNAASFNMQNVEQTLGGSLNQVEQDMNNSLQQIASTPSPSPTDLVVFQAQMASWSAFVQTASGIAKEYGDTLKNVANNIGS